MGNPNKTKMTTWKKSPSNLLGNKSPKAVDPPFFFSNTLESEKSVPCFPSLKILWIIFLWIIRKKTIKTHTHTHTQNLSNLCQPPNFLLVVWNYNRIFKEFWTSTPFLSTGNPQKFVIRSKFRASNDVKKPVVFFEGFWFTYLGAKEAIFQENLMKTSLWNLFELVVEPTDFGRVSLQNWSKLDSIYFGGKQWKNPIWMKPPNTSRKHPHTPLGPLSHDSLAKNSPRSWGFDRIIWVQLQGFQIQFPPVPSAAIRQSYPFLDFFCKGLFVGATYFFFGLKLGYPMIFCTILFSSWCLRHPSQNIFVKNGFIFFP